MAATFNVTIARAAAAPSRAARTSKQCAFSSGRACLRLAATVPRRGGYARRQAVLPRAEVLWTLQMDKKQPAGAAPFAFEPLNLTEMMDCRRVGPNNSCTLTVGAADDDSVDVFLPIPTISGKHAEFETDGETGALFVTDLNSTNGTFINGQRVEGKTKIKAGDLISFGDEPVFVCHRNAMAHA